MSIQKHTDAWSGVWCGLWSFLSLSLLLFAMSAALSVSYFPIPSPRLGVGRGREPCVPLRVRRVAYYGPLAITYDCAETVADGEVDRDVLEIAFIPNAWQGELGRVRDPDVLLNQALVAIQQALNISVDELIENAPSREDA